MTWSRLSFDPVLVVVVLNVVIYLLQISLVESLSAKSTKPMHWGMGNGIGIGIGIPGNYYGYRNGNGNGNEHRYSRRNWGLLRAQKEERTFDNANGNANGNVLNWNISRLLECDAKGDVSELEPILVEVYQAALHSRERSQMEMEINNDMDMETEMGIFSESNDQEMEMNMKMNIPARLASMRRFMRISSMDIEHEGRFRVFGGNNDNDNDNPNAHLPSSSSLPSLLSTTTTATASATTTTRISLPSTLVFSMDHPLSFIQTHLSYQSDPSKKGGMLCDNSEAVVWCVQKDLNLEYTSRVLDDMPLAQLHLGSFPDCEVQLDEGLIHKLESLGVLMLEDERGSGDDAVAAADDDDDAAATTTCTQNFKSSEMKAKGGTQLKLRRCKIRSQDLDVVRNLLSFHDDNNHHQIQNQQVVGGDFSSTMHLEGHHTLVKLIDGAVESARKNLLGNLEEPHLVICAHSTNASVVAAALSTWKQQKLRSTSYKTSHVEDLLHTAVTVVTVGAVCQKFCDGPAYIHISMYDDYLAERFGVTQKNQSGGGRNAVYLQAWSPYSYDEESKEEEMITSLTNHDSHNMNACAIQFLCLVMRINGITSFRDLYNAARYIDPRSILDINPRNFAIDYARNKLGDLVIAPNMDYELLPAMIRATGGDQWLWNPIPPDLDESEFLPDAQEAKVYLEEYFGYSTYEEIYESCCGDDPVQCKVKY